MAHGRTLRELRAAIPRRLLHKTHEGDTDYIRPFDNKGLEIPGDFDPRLERTLCFPRGFSRAQGSCGASWAFAATAVASFRECLWHLHSGRPSAGLHFMSSQELISCAPPGD